MNAFNPNLIAQLPSYLNFTPLREKQTRNGVEVDGKWWVVNPHTDEVIGDGKRNHKPAGFNIMWQALRDGLHHSGLQLEGVTTTFSSFNNNAGMRAEITLPNHSYRKALGEPACLKIRVVDSHDQTYRRQIGAMIMRLACMNGMISMAENTSMSQMHTIHADPEVIGRVASTWPAMLMSDAANMQTMQGVRVTDDQALDFYEKQIATVNTRIGPKVNKTMLDRIMALHYSYQLGPTAYRVYNVLTHMATHVESKACVSRKQLALEAQMSGVINGPAFKELAQIAA